MTKEKMIDMCKVLRQLGVAGIESIENLGSIGKEQEPAFRRMVVKLTPFAFRDMFRNHEEWEINGYESALGGRYYTACVVDNGIEFHCFISDKHVLDDMTCDLQSGAVVVGEN